MEELEELDKNGLIEWSDKGNPRKINYADEMAGKKVQDIWDFKDSMYPDYPTQKNYEMLNLIVSASSNENSIVMDCFCGSGSTLKAAQDIGRYWIGIDQSDVAIEVTQKSVSKDITLFSSNPGFDYIEL